MNKADNAIEKEIDSIAAQNNLLPEEIDYIDLSNKPVHVWEHRGLRHTCIAGTHPRHFFISRSE